MTVGKTKAAAMGRVAQYSGINTAKLAGTRFHADGTFLVDTSAGTVEIDPDELVWATTVTEWPDRRFGSHDVVDVIPVGGNIVAAGAIEAGAPPRLRAQGTTPALLFATSQHGDPIGMARLYVHARASTMLGIAVLGAIYVASGAA